MAAPQSTRLISDVSAIVLAAGASRRMGKPKMLLPWGITTVIEAVVHTLLKGGIHQPVVVLGRSKEEMIERLSAYPVCWIYNPDYETSEMLQSLQLGLKNLPPEAKAFLVTLGDQPQLQADVVHILIDTFHSTSAKIIIPSFEYRRGHPWLVDRSLWPELAEVSQEGSMRQFLNSHQADIQYINVMTSSVLMDMDTPEDYERQKPGS